MAYNMLIFNHEPTHSPIEDDGSIKFTKVPVVKDVGVVVTELTVVAVGVVNVVGVVVLSVTQTQRTEY